MDSKIEVLEIIGKISEDDYNFLSKYNTKRNKLVHSGEEVSVTEAIEVSDFSLRIIWEEIKKMDLNLDLS